MLTQNTKNDAAGLRRILQNEIAPALEELEPKQLGLLVLVQKPGSQLKEYCASVEYWLTTKKIEPGFRWEIVPE